MSRVLRRPMFRGGIADSDGVGITSGLDAPRKQYAEPNEENNYNFVQQNDTYNPLSYNSEAESQSDRLRIMREESDKKIRKYNEDIKAERQQTTENFGINPKTGLPFTQRDRLNLQPSIIDIAKAQGVDLERGENNERLTARQQQDKTKLFEKNLADKKTQELKDKALKDNKNNEPFVKDNAPIKNLTSFYDEYMSMINKANLVDQDELTKQKYLELAKFGLNLMGQPGGTPGGKRDLFGAISRAAEKPLEGYSNILTRESQMKQLPKQLALQASINAMAPGQIEKSIRELSKYMPLERAIGIVAKENTSQQRTLDMQEADYYSGKLSSMFSFLNKKENKGALDTAGQSFLNWKKIDPTLTFGQLSQIPADKDLAVDKKYYIGPNGTIVKFDKRGKQYLEASDVL
jgi:hypothetical protein